jgi:hypothetical protein
MASRSIAGPNRLDAVRRGLVSALMVLVVLQLGALLVGSTQTRTRPPSLTALNELSHSVIVPPGTSRVVTTAPAAPTTRRKVTSKPVTRSTTKAKTVAGASAPPAPLSASGTWSCIIQHESGGNPSAVNPYSGAGGLFQFLPSSWILYGGTGRPQDASVQEQWRIALNAFATSGFSPWRGNGCAH